MNDFATRLLAEAEAGNVEQGEFLSRLRDGTCPPDQLRLYAYRIASSAARATVILGSIIAHCPDRAVRRGMLENLIEEEGFGFSGNGREIVAHAGESHVEHIMRVTRRLGIDDKKITRKAIRKGNDWLTLQIRHGQWRKLLAYLTVGMEVNVPRTFRIVEPALRRHYGFSEYDTFFFSEHITADEKHGDLGLELVAGVCETRTEQEEALEGVRQGALAWRWLHGNPARPRTARRLRMPEPASGDARVR